MNTINKTTIQITNGEGEFVSNITHLLLIDLDENKYIFVGTNLGSYNLVNGEYVLVGSNLGDYDINPNYMISVSGYWQHNITKEIVFSNPNDPNYTYFNGVEELGNGFYKIAYDFNGLPIRRIKLLASEDDIIDDSDIEDDLEYSVLIDYDSMRKFYLKNELLISKFVLPKLIPDEGTIPENGNDDGYTLVLENEAGYIYPGEDGYPALKSKAGWSAKDDEMIVNKYNAATKMWLGTDPNIVKVNFKNLGSNVTYNIELLDDNYLSKPLAPELKLDNFSFYKEQTEIEKAVARKEQSDLEDDKLFLLNTIYNLKYKFASNLISLEKYNEDIDTILNHNYTVGGKVYEPLNSILTKIINLQINKLSNININDKYFCIGTFKMPVDPSPSNPIVQFIVRYRIVNREVIFESEEIVQNKTLYERKVVGNDYIPVTIEDPDDIQKKIDFNYHHLYTKRREQKLVNGVRVYDDDTTDVRKVEFHIFPNLTYEIEVASISKNGVISDWSNLLHFTANMSLTDETTFLKNLSTMIDLKYSKDFAVPENTLENKLRVLEEKIGILIEEKVDTTLDATWNMEPNKTDYIYNTWAFNLDLTRYPTKYYSKFVIEPFIQRSNSLKVKWFIDSLNKFNLLKGNLANYDGSSLYWTMNNDDEIIFNKLWYYGKINLSIEPNTGLDGISSEETEFNDMMTTNADTFRFKITRMDELGISNYLRFRVLILNDAEYDLYERQAKDLMDNLVV